MLLLVLTLCSIVSFMVYSVTGKDFWLGVMLCIDGIIVTFAESLL